MLPKDSKQQSLLGKLLMCTSEYALHPSDESSVTTFVSEIAVGFPRSAPTSCTRQKVPGPPTAEQLSELMKKNKEKRQQ